jgi:hypothetical protein
MNHVAPRLLAATLALVGCAESVPPYTPIYTAPAPGVWSYRNGGTYAPPWRTSPPVFSQPVNPSSPGFSLIPHAEAAPPPGPVLRPVDPSPALHAVDTSCGWWRLSNLWCGS